MCSSDLFCQNGALQFGPDAAWNYEVGEKAKLFGNWLTINSDIYYIKWTGVQQVITLPCGYQYYNNAGDGRSFGPELEVNAKLSNEWTASLSGAWTDAKITHPNASYTSFLMNVALLPDGVTHPCTSGSTCTAPTKRRPLRALVRIILWSLPLSPTCGYRKLHPGWRICSDGLLSSPG